MRKSSLIFSVIFWFTLLYLGQIVAYALTKLSNTHSSEKKRELFNEPMQLIIPPAKHPFHSVSQFISEKNTIFFIILIIITCLILYLIFKQLFTDNDNNKKDQDYKIAKHGSHGSAKFATEKELLKDGHYKKLSESDVREYVMKSLNPALLEKERSDQYDDNTRKNG